MPANPRTRISRFPILGIVVAMLLLSGFSLVTHAQVAPSHDPSRMIRNTDGRYWIFTTGDGIFAMSSPNSDFSNWRVENTVFPVGSWPGWIGNYVSGFNGFFWAPDVVKVGNEYRLYYSCAGQGAPAAIGLATATNLAGPWTDRGMVVAGNNAIDPAILIDGGNQWMTWGNWQSGIDLLRLNTSNGKALNSSRWDLVPGQVEAPYLHKQGSYYYLFFQRGLCCQGVNSGYTTHVARSTSVTGPYIDRNGVNVLTGGSGAGTVFLPNRDGRYIGPGHVGYGEGRLTYHFYDGDDNGAPKLRVTTWSFADGWPVAAGVNLPVQGAAPANGTYRLRNRANGKYLDNMGRNSNGSDVGQWSNGGSYNQRWILTTSGGWSRLRSVSGGLYVDSLGRTGDGNVVGMWQDSPHYNQQWTVQKVGSWYRLVNRSNGKALDTGGQNGDGASMQLWYQNDSYNQQWAFEYVSSATSNAVATLRATGTAGEVNAEADAASGLRRGSAARAAATAISPSTEPASTEPAFEHDPLLRQLRVRDDEGQRAMLVDRKGLVWSEAAFVNGSLSLDTASLPAGPYTLRVIGADGGVTEIPLLLRP